MSTLPFFDPTASRVPSLEKHAQYTSVAPVNAKHSEALVTTEPSERTQQSKVTPIVREQHVLATRREAREMTRVVMDARRKLQGTPSFQIPDLRLAIKALCDKQLLIW